MTLRPGGLTQRGPALRAMIDRGLAVEASYGSSIEWTVNVYYERAPAGRYRRGEWGTSNDGSGAGGGGTNAVVSAWQVEHELDADEDALVMVRGEDLPFAARCARCAPLAKSLGACVDRIYANGAVFLCYPAWKLVADAWDGDAALRDLRCPTCGREAVREDGWAFWLRVRVAAHDEGA